jgi:hypothetical protein
MPQGAHGLSHMKLIWKAQPTHWMNMFSVLIGLYNNRTTFEKEFQTLSWVQILFVNMEHKHNKHQRD